MSDNSSTYSNQNVQYDDSRAGGTGSGNREVADHSSTSVQGTGSGGVQTTSYRQDTTEKSRTQNLKRSSIEARDGTGTHSMETQAAQMNINSLTAEPQSIRDLVLSYIRTGPLPGTTGTILSGRSSVLDQLPFIPTSDLYIKMASDHCKVSDTNGEDYFKSKLFFERIKVLNESLHNDLQNSDLQDYTYRTENLRVYQAERPKNPNDPAATFNNGLDFTMDGLKISGHVPDLKNTAKFMHDVMDDPEIKEALKGYNSRLTVELTRNTRDTSGGPGSSSRPVQSRRDLATPSSHEEPDTQSPQQPIKPAEKSRERSAGKNNPLNKSRSPGRKRPNSPTGAKQQGPASTSRQNQVARIEESSTIPTSNNVDANNSGGAQTTSSKEVTLGRGSPADPESSARRGTSLSRQSEGLRGGSEKRNPKVSKIDEEQDDNSLQKSPSGQQEHSVKGGLKKEPSEGRVARRESYSKKRQNKILSEEKPSKKSTSPVKRSQASGTIVKEEEGSDPIQNDPERKKNEKPRGIRGYKMNYQAMDSASRSKQHVKSSRGGNGAPTLSKSPPPVVAKKAILGRDDREAIKPALKELHRLEEEESRRKGDESRRSSRSLSRREKERNNSQNGGRKPSNEARPENSGTYRPATNPLPAPVLTNAAGAPAGGAKVIAASSVSTIRDMLADLGAFRTSLGGSATVHAQTLHSLCTSILDSHSSFTSSTMTSMFGLIDKTSAALESTQETVEVLKGRIENLEKEKQEWQSHRERLEHNIRSNEHLKHGDTHLVDLKKKYEELRLRHQSIKDELRRKERESNFRRLNATRVGIVDEGMEKTQDYMERQAQLQREADELAEIVARKHKLNQEREKAKREYERLKKEQLKVRKLKSRRAEEETEEDESEGESEDEEESESYDEDEETEPETTENESSGIGYRTKMQLRRLQRRHGSKSRSRSASKRGLLIDLERRSKSRSQSRRSRSRSGGRYRDYDDGYRKRSRSRYSGSRRSRSSRSRSGGRGHSRIGFALRLIKDRKRELSNSARKVQKLAYSPVQSDDATEDTSKEADVKTTKRRKSSEARLGKRRNSRTRV